MNKSNGISTREKYFWLACSGLGAQKQSKLLNDYDIDTLYDMVCANKSTYSLNQKTLSMLSRAKDSDYIKRTMDAITSRGVGILTMDEYPEALRQREVAAAAVLYYMGDISLLKSGALSIAIVGTRHCSGYGANVAAQLGAAFAKAGVTIVSGLADGIDYCAQSAAFEAGGKTIAVLGGGLFKVSPVSSIKLFNDIIRGGSLALSEYPPDFLATKYTFPERNRIIAGISRGVLVVEAPERSGALITASCALEQGKDIFAVPGNIDSLRSAGSNTLIKNGAMLCDSAQTLLDYYKISHNARQNAVKMLDNFSQKVYNCIMLEPVSFEQLLEQLDCDVSELAAVLTELELNAMIVKTANAYCKI